MSIILRGKNIPVRVKPELESHLSKILGFPPFVRWQNKFNSALEKSNVKVNAIDITDLDYFGSRIGFLKFKVDSVWEDGTALPGIVFCRGDSVAIFLTITTPSQKYLVLTRQPRIPIATLGFLELPAGMMDDETSFVGVAAKELEEECGIKLKLDDLTELGKLAPSPGGCDEFLTIFTANLNMTDSAAQELNGRLGGLRDHGERIQLELIGLNEIHKLHSMPILAALALYDRINSL